MTFSTLIRRSLRFHARSHLGVVLGAMIGSAALIGALIVGDSVRQSLRDRALSRLGGIHFAMSTGDRFFRSDLAQRLSSLSENVRIPIANTGFAYTYSPARAPALLLPGTATRQDGAARANRVNMIGVDAIRWPRLAHWESLPGTFTGDDSSPTDKVQRGLLPETETSWRTGEIVLVNEALAQQLSVRAGDEIVLRIRKPTALALDAVITPRNENTIALRLKVGPVLPKGLLGDFSLSANQMPPANAFLPLEYLEQKIGLPGGANLLVGEVLLAARDGSRWDVQRHKWADWLTQRAPLLSTSGGARISYHDPHSFAARAARHVDPQFVSLLPDEQALGLCNAEVQRVWMPEDAQLAVRALEPPQTATGGGYIRPFVEVTSSRIFLEPFVLEAALRPRTHLLTNHPSFETDSPHDLAFSSLVTNGIGVLTYLVNLIAAGDQATPYSMVTAASEQITPSDMRDDEILVNEWLAEDLHLKPGDSVALSYYVVDSGSRLIERTNSFHVRDVVPLKGLYADRTLMPEFPGIAKAESTQDWDAGFPLVYKLRDKDEAYWKKYRGTPKAFVALAAGQAMWSNRFGTLTAIRYPVPTNTFASTCREAVYRNLLANLSPSEAGLRFEPVREQALKAAEQSQDFGQLFLGFSIFLIVAAVLLMALLFQFGLEQRASEVGTLLALGFTPKQVRRLLLAEGGALALVGGIIGAFGGIGYAKAMLWALTTVWRNAVGTSTLHFYATPLSLAIGFCASTIVALLTIWLTLRKQARRPARELLGGEVQSPKSKVQSHGTAIALVSGLAALALIGWAVAKGETSNAEVFFSAGALLLVAGLALAAAWLSSLQRKASSGQFTLADLGVRGCARRRKRSLATVALLACGSFVILAIGVFRLDANQNASKPSSGTGGFALIGESTMPVVQDLNSKSGREFFGLGEKDLAGVGIVRFRVRDGDEASCLNLNRAQKPRLLGVRPETLAGRFTFAKVLKGTTNAAWELLRSSRREEALTKNPTVDQSLLTSAATRSDEVPAIGDANSIQWALGKKIGDTLDYTDEHGRAFKIRLVGAVANSILQGNLIIDEAEFVKRFPSESGYRMFLIDAASNSVSQLSVTLARALQDTGLELTPAVRRLNAFNAVQNTYLGTFQVLGGLGLLLGSAGLGIVVLRNVLERRGELGALTALGFRRRSLQKLVLSEHSALLVLGLGIGLVAAAVAVLPALLSPGTQLPYASLAVTLGAVLLNGLLWTWLATRFALRGNLLAALRNE